MKIQMVKKVLEVNDRLADKIRRLTRMSGTLVLNFMSSPGSGKTSILEKTIPVLTESGIRTGIIEGDITATFDADRMAVMNVPVVQINTDRFGGDCHLGSEVILPALEQLEFTGLDLVIIENVGNLVCPAEFDTGADSNIVVISTTEGEDKPVKYPLMFRQCQLALINKTDLLPYLDIDTAVLKSNIQKINGTMAMIEISAKTGYGIESLANWIENEIQRKKEI